jgi:hypothetical protein
MTHLVRRWLVAASALALPGAARGDASVGALTSAATARAPSSAATAARGPSALRSTCTFLEELNRGLDGADERFLADRVRLPLQLDRFDPRATRSHDPGGRERQLFEQAGSAEELLHRREELRVPAGFLAACRAVGRDEDLRAGGHASASDPKLVDWSAGMTAFQQPRPSLVRLTMLRNAGTGSEHYRTLYLEDFGGRWRLVASTVDVITFLPGRAAPTIAAVDAPPPPAPPASPTDDEQEAPPPSPLWLELVE